MTNIFLAAILLSNAPTIEIVGQVPTNTLVKIQRCDSLAAGNWYLHKDYCRTNNLSVWGSYNAEGKRNFLRVESGQKSGVTVTSNAAFFRAILP